MTMKILIYFNKLICTFGKQKIISKIYTNKFNKGILQLKPL